MKPARFQAQVRLCSAEIRNALPRLTNQHSSLVVIAALTEHMRGALFLSRESKSCAPAQAKAMIRRIAELALTK